MRKVNVAHIQELTWSSPKEKFGGAGKQVSGALGRQPTSTDLKEPHPFDVEICRILPGKAAYPYHSHSAQWEFYYVMSGSGLARDEEGQHPIETGDAFIYPPDEAHQLINNSAGDLVLFVIVDNPIGESATTPIARNGWCVRRTVILFVLTRWSTTMAKSSAGCSSPRLWRNLLPLRS